MAQTLASPQISLSLNTARFGKRLLSAGNNFRQFGRNINRTTRRLTKKNETIVRKSISVTKLALGGLLSFVLVSIIGKMVGAFSRAFTEIPKFAFRMAADLEDGLVAVEKVTAFTGNEIEELKNRFIELAKSGPLTLKQLLKIASSAGRMGIALDDSGNKAGDAVDRIFKFSEAVAKADVAIEELDTETIALGVGRLIKLFKLNTNQASNLTSSINTLSQSLATGADSILNITVRAAGAFKAIGFTADQTIGLAGAISALGRRSEVAASSLEKIVVSLVTTKGIEKFSKFLGITTEEFAKIVNKNPSDALLKVLDAFKGMGKTKAEEALAELFGTNVRVAGSARVLAQNVDLIRMSLNKAKKSFEENVSVNEEYEKVSKTLNSRITRLKTNFGIAFIRIFNKVGDVVRASIDRFIELANQIEDMASDDSFISFIRSIIEDLTSLGIASARFAKKFLQTFAGTFEKGMDIGFLRTVAAIIDDMTDALTPEAIQGFVTGLKAGLAVVLGLFATLKDIGLIMAEVASSSGGFFQDIESAVGSFKTIARVAKTIDSILNNISGRIGQIKDLILSFVDLIALRIGQIFGVFLEKQVDNALQKFLRSLEAFGRPVRGGDQGPPSGRRRRAAVSNQTQERRDKDAVKKLEVEKAKVAKRETLKEKTSEKIEEKIKRRRSTIIVPEDIGSDIAQQILENARKQTGVGREKLERRAQTFIKGATTEEKERDVLDPERLRKAGIVSFSAEEFEKINKNQENMLAVEEGLIEVNKQMLELAKRRKRSLELMNEIVKEATEGVAALSEVTNSFKDFAKATGGSTSFSSANR